MMYNVFFPMTMNPQMFEEEVCVSLLLFEGFIKLSYVVNNVIDTC